MLKLKIGYINYYVGDGVELRRLWKKAVKKGFKTIYADVPRYDIKGTYAIQFIGNNIYWENFKTIVKYAIPDINKMMPDYRQYNDIKTARIMYKLHNK